MQKKCLKSIMSRAFSRTPAYLLTNAEFNKQLINEIILQHNMLSKKFEIDMLSVN